MPSEFTIKRRVQFYDTDMAGVLHFAAYYRYMEEVEHALWRAADMSVISREGERLIGWPRSSTSCKYLAPARFEDELELALRVVDVGERSVKYEIAIRRDGRRIAVGRTTAVCCAIAGAKFDPIPIPPTFRAVLEKWADGD